VRAGQQLDRPQGQVRPAFTLEKLDQVIDRMDDTGREGWRLMMDLGTLAHDEVQDEAHLKVQEQIEAA